MRAILRAGVIGVVCVAGLLVGVSAAVSQETAGCKTAWGAWWWPAYVQAQVWERVPYYALYPPVYYSFPVARPYGYSPFAYPPGTLTPEPTSLPGPVIENQFVPKRPASHVMPHRVTAAPLRIVNPYAAATERPIPADGAAPPGLAAWFD